MRDFYRQRRRGATVLTAALLLVATMTGSAGAGVCGVGISDAWLIETDTGTVELTFVVDSCASEGIVDYTTVPDSAAAGDDFVATSGSIDLSDEGPHTIEVPIVGDTVQEWTELFTVSIDSEDVVVYADEAIGRIADNDGVSKVVVFDNDTYVDSSDTSDAGSDNMQVALETLGHDVSTTTATDAAGLDDDLDGADAFVIPEQVGEANLADDLDQPAKDVIVGFVEAGGRLVVAADDRGLLDDLFGYELSPPDDSPSVLNTEAAAGTRFETEAPQLGDNNSTMSWSLASLPEDAKALYLSTGENGQARVAVEATHATVFLVPEGEGEVISLGWNWWNSYPGEEGGEVPLAAHSARTPEYGNFPFGQEDGWTSVLDTSVEVRREAPLPEPPHVPGTGVTGGNRGYHIFGADGNVFSYGDAKNVGILAAQKTPSGKVLAAPVVDGATTQSGKGYWLAGADGGVFAKGDAAFHGSMGGKPLNKPIVGIARTVKGAGYWLVASDGGVFSFGDATFHGSMASRIVNKPIVGIQPSPTGAGYWLVASDGGIFAFGDAAPKGSTGTLKLNAPIVDMVGTPSGNGYWLAAADGGVFAFGDAAFLGSMGATKLTKPIARMDGTGTGKGYRLVGLDGGVFSFGDAAFFGSQGNTVLPFPVVGIAAID